MREILVYDHSRVPASWMELIRPGEYAVFLSDAESCAPLTSDGLAVGPIAKCRCLLFESFAEAEAYSREAVQKFRRMKCTVFDSTGRANHPLAVFVNPEFAHVLDTKERAVHLMKWSIPFFAASVLLIGYAWWSSRWEPIFFSVSALTIGLRILHWGYSLKEEIGYRQKQIALRLQPGAKKEPLS